MIPKTMSTQHPDNASTPFFAESSVLDGSDEVQEAYYVFSHLGIEEQMWDCEGKEIDNYVVKKLLSKYQHYFKDNVLGQHKFLTLRIPNPSVEKDEAKFMIETLESIPRNYDTARVFYKTDVAPIFEVILPMTTSANEILMIYEYYRRFVAGKENISICKDGTTLKDWIGEINPKKINVIPLFETFEAILDSAKVVEELLGEIDQPYFRVFLARSDPALNYGFVAAVIISHLALRRLQRLEAKTDVPIYPIIGMGSAPFRGNLKPKTAVAISREYSYCHTFTIQSAFKYDYPVVDVIKAVDYLNKRERTQLEYLDEKALENLAKKSRSVYQENVKKIADKVNLFSLHVPKRRMRKLHVGLFGYSRKTGDVVLPRAISYCAACYSLGLPPELLDIAFLKENEIEMLFDISPSSKDAIIEACSYFNPDSRKIFGEIADEVAKFANRFEINTFHREITSEIISRFSEGNLENIGYLITEAGLLRRFLG
ncbi:MAG: phosphoenolpyruvate carboxylase [Actinobacteria bacterium]|nr:phosphoenolpyruvate carboxylase [Actinomycetota bacterium]